MANGKRCLICVVFTWLLGFLGATQAADSHARADDLLGNLPVRLYTPTGQKPILLFSTPCMELAKLDHGIGPLAGMRDLMARAVLQTSSLLPIDLQPVCK